MTRKERQQWQDDMVQNLRQRATNFVGVVGDGYMYVTNSAAWKREVTKAGEALLSAAKAWDASRPARARKG